MTVRKIFNFNDEVLHKKCDKIKEINNETLQLAQDLKDTLYKTDGIGLAAPQIGILKRMVFIDTRDGREPILIINPKIISKSGKETAFEGCLSYLGYSGEVIRPKSVTIFGLNLEGKKVTYKATGLLARCFCHELDHLEGIVYTDRTKYIYEDDDNNLK